MTSGELFADVFGRVREVVCAVVDGLSSDQLAWRADADANSIAWLVWHLTRIQDEHIAAVAGVDQAYTASGWAQRFALPFDVADTGYGHASAEIAAVVTDAEALSGYHEAVYENTLAFVGRLRDGDLDHIVDKRWDPPVTMGVRLVSVITDDLQHAGQAAFVRGLLERR